MKYLLDTNICIYIINAKIQKIAKKFYNFEPGELAISAISIAELRYGAAKSQAIDRNNLALDRFLTPLEICQFDNKSALFYGKVRSDLEKKGKTIGPLDTLIAAQALAHDLILITNNAREFNRIKDLEVENWL